MKSPRRVQINLRVTDEEKVKIHRLARFHGLSIGRLLVSLALVEYDKPGKQRTVVWPGPNHDEEAS